MSDESTSGDWTGNDPEPYTGPVVDNPDQEPNPDIEPDSPPPPTDPPPPSDKESKKKPS